MLYLPPRYPSTVGVICCLGQPACFGSSAIRSGALRCSAAIAQARLARRSGDFNRLQPEERYRSADPRRTASLTEGSRAKPGVILSFSSEAPGFLPLTERSLGRARPPPRQATVRSASSWRVIGAAAPHEYLISEGRFVDGCISVSMHRPPSVRYSRFNGGLLCPAVCPTCCAKAPRAFSALFLACAAGWIESGSTAMKGQRTLQK